jgi:hypothetical protein
MGKKGIILKDKTDLSPGWGKIGNIQIIKDDSPPVRSLQPGD